MVDTNSVYEYESGFIQLMPEGFFFVRMKDYSVSTIETVKHSHDIMQRLQPEGAIFIVVDAGVGSDSDDEIFDYILKCEFNRRVKGQAILVNDLATRLMGNLFLRYLKNQRQIKMFGTYEPAKKWIMDRIHKNGNVRKNSRSLLFTY